jgi:phage terminase small subunit
MAECKEIDEKAKLFCERYIIDFNGTQSAIEVGVNKDSARTYAYRLLKNVYIQDYIKTLLEARRERFNIDTQEIIAELRKLGFSDIGSFINKIKFTENGVEVDDDVDTSIIKKITFVKNEKTQKSKATIELHSKDKALELLMRHLGILTDNLKLSGDKENPIHIYIPYNNRDKLDKNDIADDPHKKE